MIWWLIAPALVYAWAIVPFELYFPGRCRHKQWELVGGPNSGDPLYMQCQDCGERLWDREP